MGSGDASGLATDDSRTFRPDNFESELVGGACNIAIPSLRFM